MPQISAWPSPVFFFFWMTSLLFLPRNANAECVPWKEKVFQAEAVGRPPTTGKRDSQRSRRSGFAPPRTQRTWGGIRRRCTDRYSIKSYTRNFPPPRPNQKSAKKRANLSKKHVRNFFSQVRALPLMVLSPASRGRRPTKRQIFPGGSVRVLQKRFGKKAVFIREGAPSRSSPMHEHLQSFPCPPRPSPSRRKRPIPRRALALETYFRTASKPSPISTKISRPLTRNLNVGADNRAPPSLLYGRSLTRPLAFSPTYLHSIPREYYFLSRVPPKQENKNPLPCLRTWT